MGWNLFNGGHSRDERRHGLREEMQSLLPTQRVEVPSAFPPEEVTKVCLRLKYQMEQVIPCELDEGAITKSHSSIITPKVIETAQQAGGEEYKACVVYCLLVVKHWFHRQSILELWDADLHILRMLACEVIAKRIIEAEEDMTFLLEHVLLKRFAIIINGEQSVATNVIEKAVDLHSLKVIGSSGYQKCLAYLWRGWLVQDDEDPNRFIPYENKINTSYWAHFDPDRMRVPRYQNSLHILFSLIYLILYSVAINTINQEGDLDGVEIVLYIFTLGFICDEVAKFWKVGRYYIGFWNVFNSTLYSLLIVSFVLRLVAFGQKNGSDERHHYNTLSYNFLAFTAPMFWMRMLLYFDTFRFFGAMLVVVKVMMKESAIFFTMLIVVLIGFFQGFIGLDQVNMELEKTPFVVSSMLNAIMTSPEFDFDEWNSFGHPFGIILYYIYTFVVMVLLLNILIALYNSAYEDITGNSDDEYMALFAGKCLQFVRAPDENVFIAPLNLIEIVCLVIPFEWWMDSHRYERLANYVMGIIYSPCLVLIAFVEQQQARYVRENRKRGEEDDDTVEEWEQLDWKVTEMDETWAKKVESTKPNVEVDGTLAEVRLVERQVRELSELVKKLLESKGIDTGTSTSGGGGASAGDAGAGGAGGSSSGAGSKTIDNPLDLTGGAGGDSGNAGSSGPPPAASSGGDPSNEDDESQSGGFGLRLQQ